LSLGFHLLPHPTSQPSARSERKAEVNVEAPKRPQSGYGQFFAEKRSEISATLLKEGLEAKKIMTASAKRAGEMWKALGAAKQSPYNEKSEKLVMAWTKDLEAFKTANPDYQKVKKVKKGDTDKPPTRPPGAYGMWMGENRPMLTERVMKEHSVDKAKAFLMLYKEGKVVYDALSAAEKKQCEDKAETAKVKFQADSKQWKENSKGKENEVPLKKKKGGDKGPKRPLTAYPQWLGDNRPMLLEKVMKQHSVDKTKAFLMLYKEGKPVYDALPASEKKNCEDLAAAAKVKFQADCKEWKEKSKGDKAATSPDKEGDDNDEDEQDEDEEEDEEE